MATVRAYNRQTCEWQEVPEAWLVVFPDILQLHADPVGPNALTPPQHTRRMRSRGKSVVVEQPLTEVTEHTEPPAEGDQPIRSDSPWP